MIYMLMLNGVWNIVPNTQKTLPSLNVILDVLLMLIIPAIC